MSALNGKNYPILLTIKCAEAGRVPPASGVMVSAVKPPAGLRTVKIELTVVVVTSAIPTIWFVPVALPETV